MTTNIIKIGSRKSALALWQTHFVREGLLKNFPHLSIEIVHIDTIGDRTQEQNLPLPEIGGKGLFTQELETALRNRQIDLAVHSLKDLPTALEPDFQIAAIPERAPAFDVLVSKGDVSFSALSAGAVIGTSSLRRSAQLKRLRPDISYMSIRGNVDTRIRKVRDNEAPYSATVLAHAGIIRLDRTQEISHIFSADEILPAPGQGALAVQCRSNDVVVQDFVKVLHHLETEYAVTAERSFLGYLMAGCNTPVGAFAEIKGTIINMQGRCLSADGSHCIEVSGSDHLENAKSLGERLAKDALSKGAKELLAKYENQ